MLRAAIFLKIKILVTVRHGISKRSHEQIGDCEQSRTYTAITSAMQKSTRTMYKMKNICFKHLLGKEAEEDL